jgi:DNA-directed RNA polymerase beta subunit
MARGLRNRKSFSKVPKIMEVPDLIAMQKNSFERFIQKDIPPSQREDVGLQAAFSSVFPVTDYNESSSIEFIEYSFGKPKYNARDCLQKGTNYAAPLKIKVRLNIWDKDESGKRTLNEAREQDVYIGELPLMTEKGTFIINGVERVIVSQLHRSPGVFFNHDKGASSTSGKVIYSARIIPARGSWLDFEFDLKDILYIRIDRRKKLPVTTLLKAMGYTTEQILELFYPVEEIIISHGEAQRAINNVLIGTRSEHNLINPQTDEVIIKEGSKLTKGAFKKIQAAGITHIPISRESLVNRVTLTDVIDPETGEVILESNEQVTETVVEYLLESEISQLRLLYIDDITYLPALRNTLLMDKTVDREKALIDIYKKLRPGEPPSMDAVVDLFNGLFFDTKRYDLSAVGRLKLNKRLGLEVPMTTRVLTEEDIIEIIRYLMVLRSGRGQIDDIDHLGNRRIRSVGELLENQFRIGLIRMERTIKEKMTIGEMETAMPHDLINAKPVIAAVREFFGSSQLSQFMDQTNPLSEITHKRRLSALGAGGLTRERAGFEVRDVHPTHYGRICPIETPEGPNIGLITSLATFARVNEYGFIEAPYRKVIGGRVGDGIEYLSAIDGEKYYIAQATTPSDEEGNLIGETVSVRIAGDFRMVSPGEVQYMDVSPKQIVSVSSSLIPFLENDDANRALMGSNMQRQAVPLTITEAPLVGTGMEYIAARDSGVNVVAKRAGVVESVDAERIVVSCDGEVDIYKLIKFTRSNQSTCINQKPIARSGDLVEKDQVLADGPAMDYGELALGKNVLVAFMPWRGYNFEDAILVSERLVKDDVFTSIHIEEFEIEARDTKLGPEEITRDIPNVSEEALANLDESGIIRIGAEVKAGDILVGKVTPKGETQLTPEEKLLRAIFGEKAEDVRENCLYVPPGIHGTVIDVKVLSRKGIEKDSRTKEIEDDEVANYQRDFEEEVSIVRRESYRKVRSLLQNHRALTEVRDSRTGEIICLPGDELTMDVLESPYDSDLMRIRIDAPEIENQIEQIDDRTTRYIKSLQADYDEKIGQLRKGDELPPGVLKIVKVYVATKLKIQVGDKMAGRHGNKGVVSMILPQEDMPYLPDGTSVDIVLNPLGVPSRMNVGQILETHLGLAAKKMDTHMACSVFEGSKEHEIKELLQEKKLPESGQTILYDGLTGQPFDKPVTVGILYMLKLHHLVEDKIHARSIGPYSLVTQQPLGGKAQFGGQRLGEMEVWALEAYGAAHTLQEFLTVKSDDVQGRARMYEAIVKGEENLEPGVPESFNVLIKELQSLGIDVELLEEK